MKKIMMLATLATVAFFGSPDKASACNLGHYEYRTQQNKQWVAPQNVRYQAKQWVPGRIYYVNQTQVIQAGHWVYDSCGRARWCPPVTRCIRVKRQAPGSYRTVWRTKYVPGYYKTANQRVRVWLSDCHCAQRHNSHLHNSHLRSRPIVTINGRRVAAQLNRNGATLSRQTKRTGRQVNREYRRTGSRTSKEAKRLGSRLSKQFKRIFK